MAIIGILYIGALITGGMVIDRVCDYLDYKDFESGAWRGE